MEYSYNDYLEAVEENKYLKLESQFDALMARHFENLSNIECKVLFERGSEDDLQYLYAMEAEETAEKSKGILQSLIDAIKAFFRKIKEAFTGERDYDNLPDSFQVTEDPEKLNKEAKGLFSRIGNWLKGHKVEAAALAISAGAATAYTLSKAKAKSAANEAEDNAKEAEKLVDQIQDRLQNGKISEDEAIFAKKSLGGLRGIAKRCWNFVRKYPSGESSLTDAGKDEMAVASNTQNTAGRKAATKAMEAEAQREKAVKSRDKAQAEMVKARGEKWKTFGQGLRDGFTALRRDMITNPAHLGDFSTLQNIYIKQKVKREKLTEDEKKEYQRITTKHPDWIREIHQMELNTQKHFAAVDRQKEMKKKRNDLNDKIRQKTADVNSHAADYSLQRLRNRNESVEDDSEGIPVSESSIFDDLDNLIDSFND